jgi:hypothetical protein
MKRRIIMKIKISIIVAAFMLILLMAATALAIPNLQLDILNGTYNNHSETIVATSDPFTLYAYLIPGLKTSSTDTYYISAAVFPKVGQNGADLGSFTFDNVPINVTGDMVYGNPPLETYETQLKDPGDLGSHGIFPTYFVQFAFHFDSNNLADAYNTAKHPGQGPTPNLNGAMYYESFLVDTSNLADHYFIHFDLYNTKSIQETKKICLDDTRRCSKEGDRKDCVYVVLGYDVDIRDFAPFSHDAQSGDGCDHHKVPEPETLLLLGCGLVGLAFFARGHVKQ